MTETGHRLIRSTTADGLIDALAERHPRVGLDGVLASPARRGRRIEPSAPAVTQAFRWRLSDNWSRTWWPQGIDVDPAGRDVMVASWFAQPRKGRSDARVTFVQLHGATPRYWHVLLVDAQRDAAGTVRMAPVPIHAGGVAWDGRRLLIAASSGGIREFRIADILKLRGPWFRRSPRAFGGRFVLPQSAEFRPAVAGGPRFSFLSLESPASGPQLVSGEYSPRTGARLMRFALDGDELGEVSELHDPGIIGMQGAVVVDGVWYVTAGIGDKANGDLWVGSPEGFERHEGVLPSGPEDITWWPQRGELWSHTEWPGRRQIFAINPAATPPPPAESLIAKLFTDL